jgi:acyl carrier protein
MCAPDSVAVACTGDSPVRARARRAMTARAREQVFALIQAHLADELDVQPDAISEGTRFREDLEADSLDLYTLVQELEDTYRVHMSDDQAAQILTVGQAVEFVLAHDGTIDAER